MSVREFNYNSYEELLKDVEDDLISGSDVAIYVMGKNVEAVMKELLKRPGMSIAFLNYDALDYGDDEYCVAVVSNELFVEPAKDRETDRYRYIETDVCYINGDCNSTLLTNINGYKFVYNIVDNE